MTGFKHTNVAVASNLTDYARADQVQNSVLQWLTAVAGTDTITASLATPNLTAYAAGQTFRFVAAGANLTTSVTLNINSLGAKSITKNGTIALVIGDIPTSGVVEVVYDGTQFQFIGVKPSGLATSGANSNITSLTGLTTPLSEAQGGTGTTTGYYGFKNRIINGAMGIWQRGTSFATPASGSYVSDRWSIIWAGAAPASITQVTAPAGFKYATQITGAASNTYTALLQKIESVNCTDLASQSITISANLQASTGMTVQWQLQYANASDNWGATTSITSGAWSVTTSAQQFSATISSLPAGVANGLMLVIYPNNGGAFTSGTLTITGVQLEKGSTATSFDYRPYGTELQLCQRYYYNSGATNLSTQVWSTTVVNINITTPTMRSTPTLSTPSVCAVNSSASTFTQSSTSIVYFYNTVQLGNFTGLTVPNSLAWTSGSISFSAEL